MGNVGHQCLCRGGRTPKTMRVTGLMCQVPWTISSGPRPSGWRPLLTPQHALPRPCLSSKIQQSHVNWSSAKVTASRSGGTPKLLHQVRQVGGSESPPDTVRVSQTASGPSQGAVLFTLLVSFHGSLSFPTHEPVLSSHLDSHRVHHLTAKVRAPGRYNKTGSYDRSKKP